MSTKSARMLKAAVADCTLLASSFAYYFYGSVRFIAYRAFFVFGFSYNSKRTLEPAAL